MRIVLIMARTHACINYHIDGGYKLTDVFSTATSSCTLPAPIVSIVATIASSLIAPLRPTAFPGEFFEVLVSVMLSSLVCCRYSNLIL